MMYAALLSWCEALVWVLTHSLWQGGVIAGALWVALRWLPARRAQQRYGAAVLGLVLVVLSSFTTWSVLRLERPAQPAAPGNLGPTQPDAVVPSLSNQVVSEELPRNLPVIDPKAVAATSVEETAAPGRAWTIWLAALWFVGAGVMLARTLAALVQAHGLARVYGGLTGFDLRVLEDLVRQLRQRLGLRRAVRLVVSDKVRVPCVLGTLWPCVLLPAEMLSGVPVEQWRIILAHELAHIRRHDGLVNLVQMLVESLLFFNPAVWWLSRQVRIEREASCDALAALQCGPPLSVARVLVEVAASLQENTRASGGPNTPALAPSALLAIAQPAAGELTDRVRRLVEPERASRPRVSWLGLGTLLLALLLAGAALQQGTDLAVRAAAQLMSPQERVERLVRLQAETNGVFLPPATGPAAGAASGNKGVLPVATDAKNANLKVTVVVRTEDGSPIPKGFQLSSVYATGNSSVSKSLGGPRLELPEYRKTFNFPPCRLRLGASAQGFAVVVSPVITLFAGDPERSVELVLMRGSKATFKITDEQQQPIAGAELKTTARVSLGRGSSIGYDTRTFKADKQGLIRVDCIGAGEYDQEVRAPGFQRADRVGVLDVSAPMDWPLKPARPTRLKVVDAAAGAPVPKARIELAYWQRSNHTSMHGDPRARKESSWLTYAQTGPDGLAELNELRDGTTYTFGVLSQGYGMALLTDIQGGQPDRIVKLAPPLKLAGRLKGPLRRLPEESSRKGKARYLSYSTRLTDHLSGSGSVPIDAEGRFEIGGLIAGERVTVNVPGQPRDFVMSESRVGLELKIPEPAQEKVFPKRTVVIRLVGTSPGAPARGTLYVDWRHPDPDCREFQNGPLPIRDNEVRMSVPVGALLSFFPQNVAGYVTGRQDHVEITAGDGSQIIEVEARPAGGVHGTIVRADGTPAASAFVTVFASKLPPGQKDHGRLNPDSASASSSFLLTLPLGGRYRVLARELTDAHSVWTVSDEITLDDSHPIAEMRLSLPSGKPLPIKILDPDGRPLADQPVQLQLEFSQQNGYSFATNLVRQTGARGVALFENMSWDTPTMPLEVGLHVTVPPVRFMGWQATIDPRRPVEIRLRRGLSASGVIIEGDTGKPIPRAEVRPVPRDFAQAQFKASIRTKTNARGEFHFNGLEDLEYNGYVEGTVPKGTVVTQVAGGARFSYPNGVAQHSLRAGAQNVRWEVLIYPGSSLKAAD